MCDYFRVGLGLELKALLDQLRLYFRVVLDDSVVYYDEVARAVRVRILLRSASVRGPPRVADAGRGLERLLADEVEQVLQFPHLAADFCVVVLDYGDPRGVVAAILESLEPAEQFLDDRTVRREANDATH